MRLHNRDDSDFVSDTTALGAKYYGVEQSCHGHVYRWIFDEEILSREMFDGGAVPDEGCLDACWPLGGSNSSSTCIMQLNTRNEINGFLTGTPSIDYEDPMLCDIGSFCSSVSTDNDSCTAFWLKEFGLGEKDLWHDEDDDGFVSETNRMINELKDRAEKTKCNPDIKLDDLHKIDYDDPFFGRNSDLRFSELQDLYRRYCTRKEKLI